MQLSEKHYKCIELLIKGYKYTEIAEMVPCNRQSIYNWLEDKDFKVELDKCRHEIKNATKNKVLGKTDTYLSKIEDLAFNSTSDNVKLNALTFLWETVYGKATTKIEQNTEVTTGDNKPVNINDMINSIKEDNNVVELPLDKAE